MPPPDVVGFVVLMVAGGVVGGVVLLGFWAWETWKGWR